jgi:glycosyltransferase involved in cell wall biosynthesis
MIYLSIIIATYNRDTTLQTTLESLTKIGNIETTFEIIVADNNSNDNTKAVIKSFFDKLPIKYIFEPRQGKNYAINSAIELSQGEILVFIDDDVTVDNKWLETVFNTTKDNKTVNIFGGKIKTYWPSNTPSWVHYSSTNFPFLFCDHDLGDTIREYTSSPLPWGANFWIRKSLLDKYATKFNEQFGPSGKKRIAGSETEFLRRMYEKGEKMLYIPDAVVQHRVLYDEFSLIKLLRRFAASGSFSVDKSVNTNKKTILNIPLYLYNQLLSELFIFLYNLICFNRDLYMNSIIKLAFYYGRASSFVRKKNKIMD